MFILCAISKAYGGSLVIDDDGCNDARGQETGSSNRAVGFRKIQLCSLIVALRGTPDANNP